MKAARTTTSGLWRRQLCTAVVWLLLPLSATSAIAADDCNARQKAAADRQLWLNTRDRELATRDVLPWGAPVPAAGGDPGRRLVQRDYVIDHDDELAGPVWTASRLGVRRLTGGRIDCFRQDPRIPGAVASRPRDYDEAIFDQGHMVPNADMAFGEIPIVNSFVMSNMSPQFCQFNRGVWQILEALVRFWASQDRPPLHVISGAIFDRDADGRRDADAGAVRMRARNGSVRVAVPSAYYKVLAWREGDGTTGTLTFLLPHDQTDVNGQAAFDYLDGHVTTVAEVERLAGVDLFPELATAPGERDRMFDPAGSGARTLVAKPCRRTAGARLVTDGETVVYALP